MVKWLYKEPTRKNPNAPPTWLLLGWWRTATLFLSRLWPQYPFPPHKNILNLNSVAGSENTRCKTSVCTNHLNMITQYVLDMADCSLIICFIFYCWVGYSTCLCYGNCSRWIRTPTCSRTKDQRTEGWTEPEPRTQQQASPWRSECKTEHWQQAIQVFRMRKRVSRNFKS